jgi:hypothetical protein
MKESSNSLILDVKTCSSLHSIIPLAEDLSLYTFLKGEDFDSLCLRQLKAFFILQKSLPQFRGFSCEELCGLFGRERGVHICLEQKIPLEEFEKSKEKKKSLFEEHEILFEKYLDLKTLRRLEFECPMSNVIFPHEFGKERVVFVFVLEKGDEAKRVAESLKSFEELEISPDAIKILEKLEKYPVIERFALGFRFAQDKLDRLSLYLSFPQEHFSLDFISKISSSDFSFLEGPFNYGLDYFNSHCEEKVYVHYTSFNARLSDQRLQKILLSKKCTQVYRLREGMVYEEKYEFERNLFNEEELAYLFEKFSFSKNDSIFALSIDKEAEVKKVVSYSL